jgi:transposase-like protein
MILGMGIPLCTMDNEQIIKYVWRRGNDYSEYLNSTVQYSIVIEEFNMGGHIPKTIKNNVLKRWLEGYSIEQIAREERIAAGSVSNIIQECRQNDSEFDLMRQLIVKLKNEGDTFESFASTVRLKERIRKILELPSSSQSSSSLDTTTTTTTKNGKEEEVKSKIALEHEKIESFIESLEVYCFKRNLSVKEFVDLVYRLYFIAYNEFRIPLEKLPDYVQQLEFEADTLTEQIAQKKLEMKKNVLAYYDDSATLKYNANRSLFEENKRLTEENKKLTEELNIVSRQRDEYLRDAMEFAVCLPKEEDDDTS